MTRPTQDEIDEQLNMASECFDRGISLTPGESYEAGVSAAIEWMEGRTNEPPILDEDGRLGGGGDEDDG